MIDNNKKSIIPLSNETIKKALLGATIIVGGIGLIGNTNEVYADSVPSYIADELDGVYEEEPIVLTNGSSNNNERNNTSSSEASVNNVETSNVSASTTSAQSTQTNSTNKEKSVSVQTYRANATEEVSPTLEMSEANAPSRQQASPSEQNYAKDEAKIKDFSGDERYRTSQLQPGVVDEYGDIISGGPSYSSGETSMELKDGFRYNTLETSKTSPDKTKWGIEIEFDKDKGQRTYTDFSFTNSGNLGGLLNTGNIPANAVGKSIGDNFKEANYQAESEIAITGSRSQRNLNLFATEEDIKYINNIDNKNIIMSWEGRYTSDPTGQNLRATQGPSASFSFTVNPWPNENDLLAPIKLNGTHDKKEFVQGQTFTTEVKVENLDPSARERLVGQVYNPNTGEVVPGAKAYLNDEGKVVIQMPEGALHKVGGKYVVNEESIFSTPEYKGIQSLDVKFFARPRTAEEFKAISDSVNYGGGHYTPTGAGTETINHKGQDVVIDKQGIDRYDHYNLIGSFKIKLDDTRYYNQEFIDGNNEVTSDHKFSKVTPGQTFGVRINAPDGSDDYEKSGEQMDKAYENGEATGKLNGDFLVEVNKKIAAELKVPYDEFISSDKYADKRWEIIGESDNISHFNIKVPKSAKAGDSLALPVEYTYTNGSTDVHWFHFVVQESANNKPEYLVQVDFPSEKQTSVANVPEDDKKLSPVKYTIPEGTEFKDDKGNEWTVSIDEKTGQVTAQPKESSNFTGGEKLQVPVIAHYEDENRPGEDITEETTAEFVIKERFNMTARYNAKAGKEGDVLSSVVILNTTDQYNRKPTKFTIESNTYTDDKGNTWHVTINEGTGTVTATVPNAEDGKTIDGALLNVPVTAHYYESDGKEVGTREVEVQFIASGTNGKYEKIEEIPFETKVEKDPNLKKGEIKVITEGEKGSKKVTYVIKDSIVDETKTSEVIIKEAQDRLIHVGEGVLDGSHSIEEKQEIPFETIVEFDDSLAPGEQKVEVEGAPGEQTRTTTLTIEDGNVIKTEEGEFNQTKAPVNRIIKVGRNTEGKVVHKEELPFGYTIKEVDDLKKGEYKIEKPGKIGTKTTTWIIKNSQVDGEPTVDIIPAEDAIIYVGKGTNNGTHTIEEKVEIPFETIVEFDDNLKPGEQKVTQEGAPGEKTRTNTLTIEDGNVTKTEEGEFTENKAPVNLSLIHI